MSFHEMHICDQIEFAGADTEGSGDFLFQKQAPILSLHLNICQNDSSHRPDFDDYSFWGCRVVWPRGATPISWSERNFLPRQVRLIRKTGSIVMDNCLHGLSALLD